MTDPYDLVPYTEHAYAESHPDNLRVVAQLVGYAPAANAPLHAPRVLEVGCGRGGNLLPLASSWPEATFVGVDRSAAQTRDAARVAEAAGLANVRFVTADFTGGLPLGEPFDFVLCHGVYSWIPPAARQALLAVVRAALAPSGIAYISFNTLPGWYGRLAARDWLRFAARASFAGGPREALGWLTRAVSPELGPYRADLGAVHERLRATDAAYLTHEYLAEEHHPVYASTLLAEADAAGLAYLGDALPPETALALLPDAVREQLAGQNLDLAGTLTLADFARNTAFRRALLVRTDVARSCGFEATERLDPRALRGLRLSSRLTRASPERPTRAPEDPSRAVSEVEAFQGAGVTLHVSGLARDALHALANAAPRSIACDALAETLGVDGNALADEMFHLWLATPGIGLHAREPELVTTVSERPRASAVARWHALDGGPITNAWHQEVVLREPIVRFLLARLDGQATVAGLAHAVLSREGATLTEAEAHAVVTATLTLLARSALLVA